MSKIHKLDPITAMKIAAGEVVERPSSVVKELVENSIDANATKISVELLDGGLKKIKIIDNGEGIAKEDIPLAFERYATSKINRFDDLFALNSFGFRGEALASISSVSQVKLISGQNNYDNAWLYTIDDTSKPEFTKTAPLFGTSLEIKNLFYNVPARRKFLKSVSQEYHFVFDILMKYAISYEQIHFTLKHQNKIIFTTTSLNTTEERFKVILTQNDDKNLLKLSKVEIFKNTFAEAWLFDSTYTNSSRNYEIIFVNGRLIKNKEISKILEKAYESYIPSDRYPVFLLKLTIPGDQIDVNIHPAKTEIKLTQLNLWSDNLLNKVRDVLWQNDIAVPFYNNPTLPKGNIDILQRENDFLTSSENFVLSFSDDIKAYPTEFSLKPENLSIENSHHISMIRDTSENYNKKNSKEKFEEYNSVLDKNNLNDLLIIGQLNNTFILAQTKENLYIIDQHTCHERILYEKYSKLENNKIILSQNILIPEIYNFTYEEMNKINKYILYLREYGIILEKISDLSFSIKAFPSILYEVVDYKKFITNFVNYLESYPRISNSEIRKELVIMNSCKGAIKANCSLSITEMKQLIFDLSKTSNPHTCPHGRPIIIKISMNELYLKFNRGSYK